MERQEDSLGEQLLNHIRGGLPNKDGNSGDQGFNKSLFSDPFFIRFMHSSPSGIAIFNNSTLVYEYFSPNMEDILGYPVDKLQGLSGAEFTLNTFHPDHMNVVIKQMEQVKKYYQTYAKQKRVKDTRYTFTLQLKRANEQYIWTLMQTVVVEVRPDGFPYRSMVFISDINGVKVNNKVDFVFSLKNKATLSYETVHASHHETGKEYRLSEREIDVLNCISKGLR